MAKSLSNDLRERLVAAVEGGMPRRSASQRFGVAASTAIKWVDLWRRTGDIGEGIVMYGRPRCCKGETDLKRR